MRCIAIALVLLGAATTSPGQAIDLWGTVETPEHSALQGCVVSLRTAGLSDTTDSAGTFHLYRESTHVEPIARARFPAETPGHTRMAYDISGRLLEPLDRSALRRASGVLLVRRSDGSGYARSVLLQGRHTAGPDAAARSTGALVHLQKASGPTVDTIDFTRTGFYGRTGTVHAYAGDIGSVVMYPDTFEWCDGISNDGDTLVDEYCVSLGTPPTCSDAPQLLCDGAGGACDDLLPFDPDTGYGYIDYPVNGETLDDQYRSYARRDLIMAIKHVSHTVRCMSEAWGYGLDMPIGLGDMSESDGSCPGAREGSCGYQPGVHIDGRDVSVAYYQLGTQDNNLRPVCAWRHATDGYHCDSLPTSLDVYRTALFIGLMRTWPGLRVVGVDGKIGPSVDVATNHLCDAGWLPDSVRSDGKLRYETEDGGLGWFQFHFVSMHVSAKAF
ncbi:MAG: hypothetical protein GF331_05970 [Chitinivibrionales bacterium]|nr:hypothetical protein [Chitinivibrionales bacterium]